MLSLQVEELPVRPYGRCLIGAINATIVGKDVYLAVEREAVGTAGAGAELLSSPVSGSNLTEAALVEPRYR